jgi:hypothetical protein
MSDQAATRGNWDEVWDSAACRGAGEADRWKQVKAADDGGAGAEAAGGPPPFRLQKRPERPVTVTSDCHFSR